MAVVHMQKVALIAQTSLKEEVIDALHAMGALEIIEATEGEALSHTEVRFREAEIQFAIEKLKTVASKETLKRIIDYRIKDVLHAAHHTDVRGIVGEIHDIEEHMTNTSRTLQELKAKKELLSPWLSLKYPLSIHKETAHTIRFLGTIPEAHLIGFTSSLSSTLSKSHHATVRTIKGFAHCEVIVWKEKKETFEELATSLGWTHIDLPKGNKTVKEIMEDIDAEEKRIALLRTKQHKRLVELSRYLPNIMKVRIFLTWLDQKQHARESTVDTRDTFTLFGWIPKKSFSLIERKLAEVSTATVLLKIKQDKGDEPPVLLKNPTAVTPFQSVTTLYGLPLAHERDPTSALTPFFALFFALCLTDAGYGAALALIFGTVILKKKSSPEKSPLLWTLFLGGCITFLVGILFGGWFGLSPEFVPSMLTKGTEGNLLFRGQIWNLNEQSGVTFLQNLSLALGITHLSFGMFLKGQYKWIHGEKLAAFFQDFSSIILIATGLMLYFAPAELKQLAQTIFIASLILFVWGQGHGSTLLLRPLMGLLGTINFCISLLGNSLSYLRILALGLVTGAIAMAINQVAIEVGKLFPLVLAIPAIVLIFSLGHLVSIALNTLGSFVHSGRLQFIEFFSQFFEGGGRAFSPFRRSVS